jgi:hypothetical protein
VEAAYLSARLAPFVPRPLMPPTMRRAGQMGQQPPLSGAPASRRCVNGYQLANSNAKYRPARVAPM